LPFTVHPWRRLPVQCAVTHNAGPFQYQWIAWNLLVNGSRLHDDCPLIQLLRSGEK